MCWGNVLIHHLWLQTICQAHWQYWWASEISYFFHLKLSIACLTPLKTQTHSSCLLEMITSIGELVVPNGPASVGFKGGDDILMRSWGSSNLSSIMIHTKLREWFGKIIAEKAIFQVFWEKEWIWPLVPLLWYINVSLVCLWVKTSSSYSIAPPIRKGVWKGTWVLFIPPHR